MSESGRRVTEPAFIAEPVDPNLRTLYEYWNALRGDRPMPRRAEIEPAKIPKLLPYIVMYTVLPDGGYTVRLVGEEIVNFYRGQRDRPPVRLEPAAPRGRDAEQDPQCGGDGTVAEVSRGQGALAAG
jgi:hypothetical protein